MKILGRAPYSEQPKRERRAGRRYEISMPLRYAVVRRQEAPGAGSGVAVNISRNGLLYRCDEAPECGEPVVVVADWPAWMPGNEPMKLLVTGNIVRVQPPFVAVAVLGLRLLPEGELFQYFKTLGANRGNSRVALAVASLGNKLPRTTPVERVASGTTCITSGE